MLSVKPGQNYILCAIMLKTLDHGSVSHHITQCTTKAKPQSSCSSPFTSGHSLTLLLCSPASPQETSLWQCTREGATGPDLAALWAELHEGLDWGTGQSACQKEGCTCMSYPRASHCSGTIPELRFHVMDRAAIFHRKSITCLLFVF